MLLYKLSIISGFSPHSLWMLLPVSLPKSFWHCVCIWLTVTDFLVSLTLPKNYQRNFFHAALDIIKMGTLSFANLKNLLFPVSHSLSTPNAWEFKILTSSSSFSLLVLDSEITWSGWGDGQGETAGVTDAATMNGELVVLLLLSCDTCALNSLTVSLIKGRSTNSQIIMP